MKSKYTYRQLQVLRTYGGSPLSIIAHIDLDAFYSQVEQVRLGLDDSAPLAVQQWQGLIAINYPAREYGITRHENIEEARKKCPHIQLQHVATWEEGDTSWAYHENPQVATHKVSLDPYRRESRKILEIFRQFCDRVEKASIDESFLDLSKIVYERMLQVYPELQLPPPYNDPTEKLPMPPSEIKWNGNLIPVDEGEHEDDLSDWDDIAASIGANIVAEIRAKVRSGLKYTCSAGIAQNKMLAKLGSACKKPNAQTILRNRAVLSFMKLYKFTKIRNLGGKLGEHVCTIFDTDEVSQLLQYSIETIKAKLGDETGIWVFNIIRGRDSSEVNPRVSIKSMLSAKSFRPSINSFASAERWLRIFVADIFSRMSELPDLNRPKTMTLHHRHGGTSKSRQAAIPPCKVLNEEIMFGLAKGIMRGIEGEGKAWPCYNLSLAVTGFEGKEGGMQGIESFLLRGDVAKVYAEDSLPDGSDYEDNIGNIFSNDLSNYMKEDGSTEEAVRILAAEDGRFECGECHAVICLEEREEHVNFHFAKNLSDNWNHDKPTDRPNSSHNPPQAAATKRKIDARLKDAKKLEKGQKKLAF